MLNLLQCFLGFLFSLVLCLSSLFSPRFCPEARTADDSAHYCPGVSVGMCLFVSNFSWHRAMHIITHTDHFHTPPQSCLTSQGLRMVGHTHASHYSWRLHCCYKRHFHVCGNEQYEFHYIPFFSAVYQNLMAVFKWVNCKKPIQNGWSFVQRWRCPAEGNVAPKSCTLSTLSRQWWHLPLIRTESNYYDHFIFF